MTSVTPNPAQAGVEITIIGSEGFGRVQSNPAGIDCPDDCEESYEGGTEVILTATAAEGFQFQGWGGDDCSGTDPCTINTQAEATYNVTATFVQTAQVSLTVTGVGSGMVTSSVGEIACDKEGGTCQATLPIGTEITLTPAADTGYFFNGWLGDDCNGVGACTFTVDGDATIQGSFVMVAFWSQRALDGTDAANAPNNTRNIWTVLGDGSGDNAVTENTALNADNRFPRWSPDGEHLAFDSVRSLTDPSEGAAANGDTNVWVARADESEEPRALTEMTVGGTDAFGIDWSPDGTWIVFTSARNLDGTDTRNTNGTGNVWIVDLDGSNETPLTMNTGLQADANLSRWSPDGSRIAYFSRRDPTNPDPASSAVGFINNIWVVGADGTGETALTQFTAANADSFHPAWSPDGAMIAFQSSRNLTDSSPGAAANGVSNIWIMNADGSSQTALTDNITGGGNNNQPQWSPDGTRIVFYSERNLTDPAPNATANAVFNIWIINTDGSGLQPLTELTLANFTWAPWWSPDGTKIFYESTRNLDGTDSNGPNNSQNIWSINPDGTDDRPLTGLTAPDAHAFSPYNFD